MSDDEAFLQGIPTFLRRPAEPVPPSPKFMAPAPASPPPSQIPDALQAPESLPGRKPGALEPLPQRTQVSTGRREAAAAAAGPSEVVSLPRRDAAAEASEMPNIPSPADFFSDARLGIEALLDGHIQDPQDEADDAAFQVTLPRSVIRQIRILAAREGTTQRAVVLKALRLAGLAVPKGADIDRRILAARRRQQA